MSYRSGRFWQPDVTVATIVVHEGQLLMVEEEVSGRRVLNQPAGHLEPDESLIQAAVRETLEETAWQVELTHFVGAYQWYAAESDRHFLRFAFAAQRIAHQAERTLDNGIIAAHWLSPSELFERSAEHRSPLVGRVVTDYLAGQRFPLSAVDLIQ